MTYNGVQYQPNTLQWRFHLTHLVRSPPMFDTPPNSQPLLTTASSPNLLCHKTVITWLILPTFLSTRRLDVEGNISWRGKCHKLGRNPDGQSREFLLRPQQTCNRKPGASYSGRLYSPHKQPTCTGLKNSSPSCVVTQFQGDYFLLRVLWYCTRTVLF